MKDIGQNIDGFVSEGELEWLYEQALKMETIVEIGSWMGKSTYALCTGCKGKVYAVDHFRGSVEHYYRMRTGLDLYGIFMNNMKEFTNLEVFKMTSEEASKSKLIPEFVDMVFIDGSHDYNSVISDFRLWYPRVKKLFCGHDYAQDGVPMALKEYFGDLPQEVSEHTALWMVQL